MTIAVLSLALTVIALVSIRKAIGTLNAVKGDLAHSTSKKTFESRYPQVKAVNKESIPANTEINSSRQNADVDEQVLIAAARSLAVGSHLIVPKTNPESIQLIQSDLTEKHSSTVIFNTSDPMQINNQIPKVQTDSAQASITRSSENEGSETSVYATTSAITGASTERKVLVTQAESLGELPNTDYLSQMMHDENQADISKKTLHSLVAMSGFFKDIDYPSETQKLIEIKNKN